MARAGDRKVQDPMDSPAAPDTRNLQAVQTLFDFLNAHNTRGVLECVDADVEWHDLPTKTASRGWVQVRDHLDALFDAVPDVEYRLQDVVVDQDLAIARFQLTASRLGRLRGIRSGGGESSIAAVGLLELRGGRIASYRCYFDPATFPGRARPSPAALLLIGGVALVGFIALRSMRRWRGRG